MQLVPLHAGAGGGGGCGGGGGGGGSGKAAAAAASAAAAAAAVAHTQWVPESPEMAAPLDADAAKALLRVLEGLQRHHDSHGRKLADVFYRLPTPEELPEYYRLIPKPVDLALVFARLLGGAYANVGDFEYDCELMLENALGFNEPGGWIHVDAGRLRGVLRKSLAKNVAGYEPPPGNMERPPIMVVEVGGGGEGGEGTSGTAAAAAAVAAGVSGGGAGEGVKYPGRAAVGRRLRVFWKDEGAFFSGQVTAFDSIAGTHTVGELHKSNSVYPYSLKAPGFPTLGTYNKVRNWCQPLLVSKFQQIFQLVPLHSGDVRRR
jgi:hypothetical protein